MLVECSIERRLLGGKGGTQTSECSFVEQCKTPPDGLFIYSAKHWMLHIAACESISKLEHSHSLEESLIKFLQSPSTSSKAYDDWLALQLY
jgi:hypothetical protein